MMIDKSVGCNILYCDVRLLFANEQRLVAETGDAFQHHQFTVADDMHDCAVDYSLCSSKRQPEFYKTDTWGVRNWYHLFNMLTIVRVSFHRWVSNLTTRAQIVTLCLSRVSDLVRRRLHSVIGIRSPLVPGRAEEDLQHPLPSSRSTAGVF